MKPTRDSSLLATPPIHTFTAPPAPANNVNIAVVVSRIQVLLSERERVLAILIDEKTRARKRLAHDPAERDRTLALLNRLKKAICDSPTTKKDSDSSTPPPSAVTGS